MYCEGKRARKGKRRITTMKPESRTHSSGQRGPLTSPSAESRSTIHSTPPNPLSHLFIKIHTVLLSFYARWLTWGCPTPILPPLTKTNLSPNCHAVSGNLPSSVIKPLPLNVFLFLFL